MADDLPAELREAAGRAAHAAYRAAHAGATHTPAACPSQDGSGARRCPRCDALIRAWPDLIEAQREEFRASQDPALSLVAPVLAECAAALRESSAWHERESMALGPPCLARALARLAEIGVRP